jgi:hypothetical protein
MKITYAFLSVASISVILAIAYRQSLISKSDDNKAKWLAKIDFVKVGEEKEVIEERIAKLLGSKNIYNVYVQFDVTENRYLLDTDFELVIWFEKGTPGFMSSDGVNYPPTDSRVIGYLIRSRK